MWEEGAWENSLWMQIWGFYSPAHEASPGAATALLLPCQEGRGFEGSGAGPGSALSFSAFISCQLGPAAWLPHPASHSPPWSHRTQQPQTLSPPTGATLHLTDLPARNP